ncbi:hypothetical protein ACLOJK_019706 [Asimina triloba]
MIVKNLKPVDQVNQTFPIGDQGEQSGDQTRYHPLIQLLSRYIGVINPIIQHERFHQGHAYGEVILSSGQIDARVLTVLLNVDQDLNQYFMLPRGIACLVPRALDLPIGAFAEVPRQTCEYFISYKINQCGIGSLRQRHSADGNFAAFSPVQAPGARKGRKRHPAAAG